MPNNLRAKNRCVERYFAILAACPCFGSRLLLVFYKSPAFQPPTQLINPVVAGLILFSHSPTMTAGLENMQFDGNAACFPHRIEFQGAYLCHRIVACDGGEYGSGVRRPLSIRAP